MTRTIVATDNFNRSNGGLGSNWTDCPDEGYTPKISSNVVVSSAGFGDAAAFWGANSFNNDHYSKMKLNVVNDGVNGDTYSGLMVRASTSDWVQCTKEGQNLFFSIYWYNSGAYTEIAGGSGTPFTDGNTYIFDAVGSTFSLYESDGTTLIMSGTNISAPSSGKPGFNVSRSGDSLDDWEGGNITSDATTKRLLTTLGVGS